jgi:hypothetical protein
MIPSSIHFRYFQRIYRPTPPTSLVPFKTPEHVPTPSGVLPFKLFRNRCAVRRYLTSSTIFDIFDDFMPQCQRD